MTHLDLFSGIGGFCVAAQACGYTTIGFCEREPYAQQILKERFGAVSAERCDHCQRFFARFQCSKHLLECDCPICQGLCECEAFLAHSECNGQHRSEKRGSSCAGKDKGRMQQPKGCDRPRLHPDIFTLNGADYAGVDLLTGGFPCQPFSVAGKRLGKADDRAIWPEMLRVIREAKPAWIIGENVNGIVSMELDNILSDLEGIGYAAWPLVVPACAVDARHRRDRVWIVAHANERRGEQCDKNERSFSKPDAERAGVGEDVADAIGLRESQSSGSFADERGRAGNQGEDVADADSQRGCVRQVHGEDASDAWESSRPRQRQDSRQLESAVCGMADGIPEGLDSGGGFCQWPEEDHETPRVTTGMKHRAHRLKGLGNAIVVQVATEIIRAIANLR